MCDSAPTRLNASTRLRSSFLPGACFRRAVGRPETCCPLNGALAEEAPVHRQPLHGENAEGVPWQFVPIHFRSAARCAHPSRSASSESPGDDLSDVQGQLARPVGCGVAAGVHRHGASAARRTVQRRADGLARQSARRFPLPRSWAGAARPLAGATGRQRTDAFRGFHAAHQCGSGGSAHCAGRGMAARQFLSHRRADPHGSPAPARGLQSRTPAPGRRRGDGRSATGLRHRS